MAATSSGAAPAEDRRALLRRCGRSVARGALLGVKVGLALAALAAVGLAGYHGYRRAVSSRYFTVKRLLVKGARHALPDDLRQRVARVRGVSIFRVPTTEVAQALAAHPWVASARVHRELPDRLVLDVTEHRPAAVVLMGHLYLVSDAAELFKKARAEEAAGLPVITGISRLEYLNHERRATARIRGALAAIERYRREIRPPLSEVHVGSEGELTFYLRRGGTALRFGTRLSDEQLRKLDAVWAALGPSADRARALYLDHEVRTDRVVVRLGSAKDL